MAGTTTKSVRTSGRSEDVADVIIQFNKLVDDLETLRASVQAGTGVTPVAAAALTAGKIGNRQGVVIT